MNYVRNKYNQYAIDIIENKTTSCEYVKNACKRYLSFFDKYEFREDVCDRVINFISKLRHFTGSVNGKPFILEEWQKFIIYSIFGFYKEDGTRLTKKVYIEVARKNGKTSLLAAIALYCLIADNEANAECDFLANSAKQSTIAFNMCSNYLQSIDKKGKYFRRYRDSIKFDKTKSIIQCLSSEASSLDGFNSHFFCLDEAHEQQTSKLWDVMVSSQGMRKNPLGVITTTAGFKKMFCYEFRQTGIEVAKGLKEDDSFFTIVYTLDENDDWQDPNVWIKANPNLGITVQKSYIEDQITSAKTNPSLEVGIRTKNLNCWVESADVWIPGDLLLNSSQNIELSQFPKETFCYLGVDLASVSDLTALSVLIPYNNKFYFKTWYYLPQSCLENNSNAEQYKEWKRRGYVNITSGNVTDYDQVTSQIKEIYNHLLVHKVAYDAYNATSWAIDCTSLGYPLEPYSQALWSFNKPTKEFERLIKMGKVIIDNNPITRYCFQNVALKIDHNENMKPVKGGSSQQKIDGVISMLEALGIYLAQPIASNSII